MPMVRPISPPTPTIIVFKLALLGNEESHVGGDRQLRHLQRHRNDHAQHRGSDHNRCSDFARASGVELMAFNHPREPIRITRFHRASTNDRAHKLFRWRTFDDRNSGRAHAEKILVGILYFDADGETLRDAHPVQFPFHVRHTGGR